MDKFRLPALKDLFISRRAASWTTRVLTWAIVVSPAFGSSALLRARRQAMPEAASVATYGGVAPAKLAEVRPATALTVVWAGDGVTSAASRSDVLAVFDQLHGRTMRLAMLRGSDVEIAGPFASRADLESALAAAGADGQASGIGGLDTLSRNAGKLGGRWSPVLLMGGWPKMDEATAAYAQSKLERSFAACQLRAFVLARDGAGGWLPVVGGLGGAVVASLAELNAPMDEASQRFEQIAWSPAAAPAGFIAFPARVEDGAGRSIAELPDLAEGAGGGPAGELPAIADVAAMQKTLAQVAEQLRGGKKNAEELAHTREILASGQKLNPVDPELLRAETLFFAAAGAAGEAVKAAVLLTMVRPADAASWAMLGHAQVLAGDWDKAESALNNAAQLKAGAGELAGDYGRVHLGRGDAAGALPYLRAAIRDAEGGESHANDTTRAALYFLQSEAAQRVGDRSLAESSLEQGLALDKSRLDETVMLLRMYVSGNETAKAKALAARTLAAPIEDAAEGAEFAEVLSEAKLGAEADAAWKMAFAAPQVSEDRSLHVAALLLKTKASAPAAEFLTASLQTFPKSAKLYLAKADYLSQRGEFYEARAALEAGAAATGDVEILTRLAAIQQSYADRAEGAYAQLADAVKSSPADRIRALQNGFDAALRDGETQQAAAFANQLAQQGQPGANAALGGGHKAESEAMVPGGLDGLAQLAHMRPGTSPERFFTEYARTLTSHVCMSNCAADEYAARIEAYFDSVAQLESLGKRDGNRVTITLSVGNDADRRHTDEVLGLFGIAVRTKKGKLTLDQGEKEKQAHKQDLLAAMALDQVGIEDALQAGRPYAFEVQDQAAQVFPSEQAWAGSFPLGGHGGFAAALLESPRLARLYVGLSAMDRRTRQVLLDKVTLKELSQRYADLLALYGTSFAVHDGHAAVPGGVAAEPLWERFVGVSPQKPGEFFVALLNEPNPGVLGYFYTLSQLDQPHQAFFTASLTRMGRFEVLFASMEQAQGEHSVLRANSSCAELLRSVPLDGDGHVIFPGSARIWMGAKDNIASELAAGDKGGAVSAGVEDEILLRLANTRTSIYGVETTDLDKFLAVARVNAHRSVPLSEESALLLDQRHNEFGPIYAYFSDLRAIDSEGFRSMFGLFDRMRKLPPLERNQALGQLYALIEWDALLSRRGAIDDTEAARIFSLICERLNGASEDGARASASLSLAGMMLTSCSKKGPEGSASWDDALRACFVGIKQDPADEAHRVRDKDFRAVLNALRVPSLDMLHTIDAGAAGLQTHGKDAVSAMDMAQAAKELPSVPLPKQASGIGNEREAILMYEPATLQRLTSEAAKTEHDARQAERLAAEIRRAMEPQVTAALAGPIYAFFLRSSDLIVGEDPLLIRKHRYFEYGTIAGEKTLITAPEFKAESEGIGSYLQGGFSQFGVAAAEAATAGWHQGGNGGNTVIVDQLAAIRSAAWDQLTESDQRLASLRILCARDWIVQAADSPAQLQSLTEAMTGLLSLSRRAELLNGIEERDWQTVWASITLPDLFMLGGRYLKHPEGDFKPSPAGEELRRIAARNDGSRLHVLARIPFHTMGCNHPHMTADAPYEAYERRISAEDLAERSAEFKLFLAYRADSLGVAPSDVGRVAEELAAKALGASQMNDYHDWRSLLAAYGAIDNNDLAKALER